MSGFRTNCTVDVISLVHRQRNFCPCMSYMQSGQNVLSYLPKYKKAVSFQIAGWTSMSEIQGSY